MHFRFLLNLLLFFQLGVQSAFRDDLADLSGIAGDPGDLVLDQIIQKTFVGVNEHGVEASAATYVGK